MIARASALALLLIAMLVAGAGAPEVRPGSAVPGNWPRRVE